jgi:hypothetical protein
MAAVSLKDQRMISIAENWLEGDKSFRPLRFLSGVEGGVIGCEISQVNVVNGDDVAEIVHIMSAVKPGRAQEAGVRPMDILLEVDGHEVSGHPIEYVRSLLQDKSVEHSGEFSVTIGRVMESEEEPSGWGQYFDQQHMKYYYNSDTLQSAWKVPTADLPHPWIKVKEEDDSISFLNQDTQEKITERPMSSIPEADQPVLAAGWLNKRRSTTGVWRPRWVTVMRNGEISWAKSMADNPLGSCSLIHSSFVAALAHDGTGRSAKELYTIALKFEISDQKGQKTMELATEKASISEKFQTAITKASELAEEVGHSLDDHFVSGEGGGSPGKQLAASNAAESRRWTAAAGGLNFDPDAEYDEAPFNARVEHQGWFKKKGSAFPYTMRERYGLLQGRNIRYFDTDKAASDFIEHGGTGFKGNVVVTGVLKKGQGTTTWYLHVGLVGVGGKGKVLELEFGDEHSRDKWETAVNNACDGFTAATSEAADETRSLQKRMTTMSMARRDTARPPMG